MTTSSSFSSGGLTGTLSLGATQDVINWSNGATWERVHASQASPPPAPPPATPPPALPAIAPGPIASITGDPHIRGAHGDRTDFKGEHLGIYVILSTKHLSLAVQFEHDTFFTPYSKMWVRGSWIRHAYWTIRTSGSRLLTVELDAHQPKFNGSAAARLSVVDD
eukprot:628365-Prymnesium_polylepis.1